MERLAEQYHQNFDEVKRWYDGYLGYDQYTRTAFIPNEEIRQELTMQLKPSHGMKCCFKPVRELPTGRGFADFVYLPKPEYRADYPALIVELKWNQSAQTAMQLMKELCAYS